ncbi:PAS domain S-box-containing protein [Kitasatospora sp. GP30]|uniref:hybrid sensor histidine kinase/response regulator n=1 Tax=Kitasatospora sp. GP30 TaxID=3035084 RepID=UPI000C714BC7|nr:PAS domain-containing protein [Kitasatospora sp. GP30]MDH6138134.1 PAS domain S-box-containing protein [Kitasatospora sp. GP30]
MSSRPIRGAARLAAILDALPDALLLVNSNGTVVDANQAAVQAMQTPGTSLIGRGVLDLLPEFDPSRIPGSMRPVPKDTDEAAKPVRMTARRTDGSSFPCEVLGNDFADDGASEGRGYAFSPPAPYDPYRTGSSANDLLLLMVRDLSGRLGVEAELRRQHKQTEMILRAAAEGVLGVDLEGRVVLVNPAAAHILDFRASELGGRELHTLVQHSRADGTPLAADESALLDTLSSGRKHRVRGATLWRKDGRPVTVDLTTAPVRDGDQLVGAVMTFTDRTQELALTARAEHLSAVLETEVSGALQALRDRIDRLAADPAGQLWPEANWMLRALADDCRRFGVLIEGVLAHQQADGPEQELHRAPTSLETLVTGAVEQAGRLVGPGRLRFSVHAGSVELTADQERLAQALAYLVADVSGVALTGSVADGGEAPMVVVAAAQRADMARVEIRGPGKGGSKVYVPIARDLVERHGGVLQPHELPSGGTTYVVELPLDDAAAEAAAARSANGGHQVPRETDTAVLPDLPPEMVDALVGSAGAKSAEAEPAEAEAAAAGLGAPPSAPQPPAGGTPMAGGESAPVDLTKPQQPAEQPAPSSPRRRRALPERAPATEQPARPAVPAAQPYPGLEQALAGGASALPVYPGLENALPTEPRTPVAEAPAPTGRRRRLGLPGGEQSAGAGQTGGAGQIGLAGQSGGAGQTGGSGPMALEPARPTEAGAATQLPARTDAPTPPAPPARPVGSGLAELAPPRPGGHFGSAFPAPAAPLEQRTPPRPVAALAPALPAPGQSELPRLTGEDEGAAPAAAPRLPEYPDYSPMVSPAADGRPRRLLVWPEPDPSTKQALQERGYRPVIVRSREEVDAQVAAYPAALFVDPLTGPITRTALQSLRTAALNSRVPVLVTAGLGQATRDAAYGADPAVLLRALAPKDSEHHAARVLLVEGDPDIAAALTASLERRGMHVEHAATEDEAVAKASSVQPNLVVMDLLRIQRRQLGLLDWLRANDRLHRTPLVVYTSVDLDPAELPRLRTGETVLFLAERSTSPDVQQRIVDLLGRIGELDGVNGQRQHAV